MTKIQFKTLYKYLSHETKLQNNEVIRYITDIKLNFDYATIYKGDQHETLHGIKHFDKAFKINLISKNNGIIGYYNDDYATETDPIKLELYLKNKLSVFNFVPNAIQIINNHVIMIFDDLTWKVT